MHIILCIISCWYFSYHMHANDTLYMHCVVVHTYIHLYICDQAWENQSHIASYVLTKTGCIVVARPESPGV